MPAPMLKIIDAYGRPIPRAAITSEYEGAASGRRMGSWGATSIGPNASLYGSLNSLRSRSRKLRRDNPLVDGGCSGYVANIIGSGINPRWQIKDNSKLKLQIQELWSDWTEESDFYGISDFYGQQSQGISAMIDAGEFLCRFIDVYPGEYETVPLKLQLLEADHLDETYNTIASNGNEIRMGIEIDKMGRRVAYWLWSEHPGEIHSFTYHTGERIRVPAEDLIHVFTPVRIGQMRGRPWLSSIIVKLHELDQYEDAELVRKKTAAMFGGFIYQEIGNEEVPPGFFGRRGTPDANDNEIVALEPGTFPVLPVGKKVAFSEPADVGITYEVWIKQQLREIAVGMGITYEQLTNDLSGVNYSSIRAGLLEFRRRVNQLQYQIIIHQFCRPIARRWMNTAVLSGALSIPIGDYLKNRRKYLRIKWRPDGWAWVDPVKDQLAEQMAVRNGFKSRSRVVAERGDDVETVDQEIAEDNSRADESGLILDTDPRRTASSGAMQKAIEETIKDQPSATPRKGENNE